MTEPRILLDECRDAAREVAPWLADWTALDYPGHMTALRHPDSGGASGRMAQVSVEELTLDGRGPWRVRGLFWQAGAPGKVDVSVTGAWRLRDALRYVAAEVRAEMVARGLASEEPAAPPSPRKTLRALARELRRSLDEHALRVKRVHAPEDPFIRDAIGRLGMGAVIDSAVRQWDEILRDYHGSDLSGGAFVLGARATVEDLLRDAEAALSPPAPDETSPAAYATCLTAEGAEGVPECPDLSDGKER